MKKYLLPKKVYKHGMDNLVVRRLEIHELMRLTELFDYRDVEDMIAENTRRLKNKESDIYVLFDGDRLVGELRAMYMSDDRRLAIPGIRAYLYAFRVHESVQGKGYGQFLLSSVIRRLAEDGYREFTVGVEDDNAKAIHIYRRFGFDELVARLWEEYQGHGYAYNLYLKIGVENVL